MNKKDEIADSIEFINDMKMYGNIPSNEEMHTSFCNDIIKDKLKKESMKADSNRVFHYLKEIVKIIFCIILAFFIAKLITTYVGQHTRVDGYSMENTLHNGDYLIIDKFSYHIKEPKRFDIIVFPYSQRVNYIKRIIGLPGETVQIKERKTFINGELLDEHYGKELIEDPGVATTPIVLGSDEYFVVGDNRNHSMDSRSDKVGTIVRDKIIGKAWVKVWPIKDFGVINHQ